MNRRALFSTTALVLPALAVAACTPGTSGGVDANLQTVFNASQFVLPLLDVLLVGVSLVVPAAAPLIALATPYLNAAGNAFQDLSLTMTTSAAKPVVQQIADNVGGVIKAVTDVIAAPGGNAKLAALAPKLQQAQAALALLTAFISGVHAMPTAATVPMRLLHR